MEDTTTPNNSRNETQKNIIQDFKEQGADPFDRKIVETIHNEHNVYNKIIFETEHFYVMPCLWPLKGSSKHIMIISQRNDVKSITDLSIVEFNDLIEVQQKIIRSFDIQGGAFCMRFGDPKISGTTVTHLHGHIIVPDDDKIVRFHVGSFNNPNKDIFEPSMEEEMNQSSRWKYSRGKNYFASEFKWGREIMKIESDGVLELIYSIQMPISEYKIAGGAFCMRFGTTVPEHENLKGYLIVPEESQTLKFEIKSQ